MKSGARSHVFLFVQQLTVPRSQLHSKLTRRPCLTPTQAEAVQEAASGRSWRPPSGSNWRTSRYGVFPSSTHRSHTKPNYCKWMAVRGGTQWQYFNISFCGHEILPCGGMVHLLVAQNNASASTLTTSMRIACTNLKLHVHG
jgi:hypothetical protein